MITVNIINVNSDLQTLVKDINTASWDDANEICKYDVNSLTRYLKKQDTLFISCYEIIDKDTDNNTGKHSILMGMASGRFEIKPYNDEQWLYVDEVDVCLNQRRRGAASAMMCKLIEIANDAGCEELWLGTETDNHAANALYRSLNPDEIAQFTGFTYEMD